MVGGELQCAAVTVDGNAGLGEVASCLLDDIHKSKISFHAIDA